MENEMIERVARALCCPNGVCLAPRLKDDGGVACHSHAHEEAARTAIAAMREPTEGMQVAGASEDVCVAYTADRQGRCLTPSHIWRAMIDAALTPPTNS